MKIVNGWLDAAILDKAKLKYEVAIRPELVVVHYGVTRDLPELRRAQHDSGFYAHFSIDGFNGTKQIAQMVSCKLRASHAGVSEWRGRKSCNAFSIGIEIANPGPLLLGADGNLRDVHGRLHPWDQAIAARHRNGFNPQWAHWAIYTEEEKQILVELIGVLRETYPSIVDVRGHDEISPGRKSDPGPAMDMDWLRGETL